MESNSTISTNEAITVVVIGIIIVSCCVCLLLIAMFWLYHKAKTKQIADEIMASFELSPVDASEWKQWNTEQVLSWILFIDNGRYMKYKDDLYDNLKKQMFTGQYLQRVDTIHIRQWGINDAQDIQILINEINDLVNEDHNKTVADSEGVEGNQLTVEGNATIVIAEDVYQETKRGQDAEANMNSATLLSWLESIDCAMYLDNFVSSGYESLDFVKEISNTDELIEINITDKQDQDKILQQIK